MQDRRHREPENPIGLRQALLALGFGLVIVVAIVLAIVGSARGADLKLVWPTPCYQPKATSCDSLSDTLEISLKGQLASMVRFRDSDTLQVGLIPEIGKECGQDSALFWVAPDSCYGTVGAILLRSVDVAGNVSCHYASYVFVVKPGE